MDYDLHRQFEKRELNSVGRHKERESYDKVLQAHRANGLGSDWNWSPHSQATISAIIREAKLVHVAFVDEDGMPQCVPMIGALEDNQDGDLILYLHG